MVFIIIYTIGFIVCFFLLNKIYNEYNESHPDEAENVERKKYNSSLVVGMSFFSWLGVAVLLFARLCNNGDYDDDDQI